MPKGFEKPFLGLPERRFHVLAVCDVGGNAQHPQSLAIGREVILPSRIDPAQGAVISNDPELRVVRLPVCSAVGHYLCDKFLVFLINTLVEILNIGELGIRCYAKDCF